MPRHNGSRQHRTSFGGETNWHTSYWHQPSRSGNRPGRRVMRRRQADMSREDFAAVLRRSGIRGRA